MSATGYQEDFGSEEEARTPTKGLSQNPTAHSLTPRFIAGKGGPTEFGSKPFQRFTYASPSRETIETVADGVQPALIPAVNRGVND